MAKSVFVYYDQDIKKNQHVTNSNWETFFFFSRNIVALNYVGTSTKVYFPFSKGAKHVLWERAQLFAKTGK